MARYESQKRVPLGEAMSLYEEELELIAENCLPEIVAECYDMYEAQQKRRIEAEIKIAYEEKAIEEEKLEILEREEYQKEVMAYFSDVAEKEIVKKALENASTFEKNNKKHSRAKRRKDSVHFKIRFINNATDIKNAYSKACEEDMFMKSSRGGIIRNMPKSKSQKAERILKKAGKLQHSIA